MSWGNGKYMDYCFKVMNEIKKKGLYGDKIVAFLNKKYAYVKTVANVDREAFFKVFGIRYLE